MCGREKSLKGWWSFSVGVQRLFRLEIGLVPFGASIIPGKCSELCDLLIEQRLVPAATHTEDLPKRAESHSPIPLKEVAESILTTQVLKTRIPLDNALIKQATA